MNITLRKAKAIQTSIQDAIRQIESTLNLEIEINEFQDPAAELKKANGQAFIDDARRQQLLLALYNVRGLVGTANANCGVDLNLAKAAFIDKRLNQLERFGGSKPMTELTVIKGMLSKIQNRPDDTRANMYGRSDVVTTSIVTQEQIDQARTEIKNLKKEKQKLNDEILELNVKTEIPLSEDVVATLKREGLI